MAFRDQNDNFDDLFNDKPGSGPAPEAQNTGRPPGKFTQMFGTRPPPEIDRSNPIEPIEPVELRNNVPAGPLEPQPRWEPAGSGATAPGEFTRHFSGAEVGGMTGRGNESTGGDSSFPDRNSVNALQPGAFTRTFDNTADASFGGPPPGIHPQRASMPLSDPFQTLTPTEAPRLYGDAAARLSLSEPRTPAPPASRTDGGGPSTDIFSDEKPSLQNMPNGPSAYTKFMNSSNLRSSQEQENRVGAESRPAVPPAADPFQSPQVVSPQMIGMPSGVPFLTSQPMVSTSVPNPNLSQFSWTPQVAPMSIPVPQPQPLQLAPQQQPAQETNKWAAWMPLIIGLNIFFLLAILFIVIMLAAR